MTHLLDLNVLIALAWPSHLHHAAAHQWFAQNQADGWATCPITQAGFVRLSSNPKFVAEAVEPQAALQLLKQITSLPNHQFWADDVALTEPAFPAKHLMGHRQITDAYLLGLAIHHQGCLATFDQGIEHLLPQKFLREQHVALIQH